MPLFAPIITGIMMNHRISFFEIFLEIIITGGESVVSGGVGHCPKVFSASIVLVSVKPKPQKANF